MNAPDLLPEIRRIATLAGAATLEYFGQPLEVEAKADDSPLTAADRASHEVIVRELAALTPEVPVLSEESAPEEVAARRSWETFWLVDPLDGTKEFVKGTGEYTVNIALVEGDRPVLGVVYQPTRAVGFLAARGAGAARAEGDGEPRPIQVREADPAKLALVLSASHASPALVAYLEGRPDWTFQQAGSSLKFCLVASGEADLYPRLGPTCEWDTGAAQCVVEQAGGRVLTVEGDPLRYNKESLKNPGLVTLGGGDPPWQEILEAARG
jgi:3'(2'), 5'-bisphosphate nucleotidase